MKLISSVAFAALVAFAISTGDAYSAPRVVGDSPPPYALNPKTAQVQPGPEQVQQSCKEVKFVRADVGSKNKFTVTFKGADFTAFKMCNPNAEQIDTTPNGVRIAVAYADGATIALPITMTSGDAHTARCVPDQTGNVVDTVLYKAVWDGGLPDELRLDKKDKAFYDADAALATCKKLNVAGKVN